MSIWGKIIGGTTGFALGGPIGALIGALAGHAVDRMNEPTAAPGSETEPGLRGTQSRQIAFTIAVITLGAKIAKADGVVKRVEVDAFKQVFHVPPHELNNVSRVFNRARREAAGFEPYAEQVAKMFAGEPAVLEELLSALFHIAKADGTYHPKERAFLHDVARIFGFTEKDFARIEAEQMGPDKADPYTILGVTPEDSDAAVKTAYRKFIRENHPDKLIAQGLPQEFIDLANERMAKVNAAYERIRKDRGRK